ncbi:SNF1-related protein kinase regulatory subunit beta-1, partial [Corchorus olitorius]
MLGAGRVVKIVGARGAEARGNGAVQVRNGFDRQVAVDDGGARVFAAQLVDNGGAQEARSRGVTEDAGINVKDLHGVSPRKRWVAAKI